jgi:hypothetical protein
MVYDQFPNSPKNRQNGKTALSHMREIVQQKVPTTENFE